MTEKIGIRVGKNQAERAGWVTASRLAELFTCSNEFLRKLGRDGHIPKAERGMYPLTESVQGYVKFLRGEHRDKTHAKAESGLKAARQREVELRIAEREGRIVDLEDIEAVFGDSIGIFRSELESLPAACTRDVELRRNIETHLNDAISRCENRFAAAEAAVRAGEDAVSTVDSSIP